MLKSFLRKLVLQMGRSAMTSKAVAELHSNLTSRNELLESLMPRLEANQITGDSEAQRFIAFLQENWKFSNSQYRQDLFVLWQLNCKPNGTYLEIGGADGITHSNSHALRKYFNWSGILVEPDPEQHRACRLHRSPGDTVIPFAIAPDKDTSRVELIQHGQLSSITGYHTSDMHKLTREQHRRRGAIRSVQTIDINNVFKMFASIDYFSLDVEGAELAILNQIDWSNVTHPTVCTVEANDNSQAAKAITSLMQSNGYRHVLPDERWITGCDLWFSKAIAP